MLNDLIQKMFALVRRRFLESDGDVRYCSLRCDIVNALIDRGLERLIRQSRDDRYLADIITTLEAVRRRGIAGDDDLLKLKNSISLVIGTALALKPSSTLNIAARTLWQTVDVAQVQQICSEKREIIHNEKASINVGTGKYLGSYSSISRFDAGTGCYNAANNKNVSNIAREFSRKHKSTEINSSRYASWIVTMNRTFFPTLRSSSLARTRICAYRREIILKNSSS